MVTDSNELIIKACKVIGVQNVQTKYFVVAAIERLCATTESITISGDDDDGWNVWSSDSLEADGCTLSEALACAVLALEKE